MDALEVIGAEDQIQEHSQYVIFQLGNEEYGVAINQVKEIIKPTRITKVPNTDDHILGVINLRGQIIPVVDLRKRLNIEEVETEETARRIITVEVHDTLIGILVDGVNEVVWLDRDDIESAPEVAGGIKQEFLEGVGKIEGRLLILVELDRLLFAGEEN